ncbi:unnamed protein product [Schistosoma margrebowiei]|uniref:Uncharacterized protein n=1 Tax=Schistosoma margrebowiei TaxID=48269 RepID=A0A183LSJ0_9TREM|nr:unnamed protein product [Schistosoma margrebowiei]
MLLSQLSRRQKILLFVLVISVACAATVGIALFVYFSKKHSSVKPCNNDNCSSIITTGNTNIICDSFEQHTCDKFSQNDYPDNLPVKTDDIIMKMFESTELKNLSSINAAKTFYNTCTIDHSMEKSFIQSKVHEMSEKLFNGWAISLDKKQAVDFWNNILATEMFNLTALILPLIFQSGTTTFFSINLTEGYSQGDNRLIHSDRSEDEFKEQIFRYLQKVGARENNKNLMEEVFKLYSEIKIEETAVGEAMPVSIEELEDFCSIIKWKVLFENVYMNESYNKLQVIVQHKEALRRTCETLKSKFNDLRVRRGIHTMLVIDFLYKMRHYLKKYVEDFYPSDIDEKPPSCIQELKENFWWTINKQHEYSSISKSTKDENIVVTLEENETRLSAFMDKTSDRTIYFDLMYSNIANLQLINKSVNTFN